MVKNVDYIQSKLKHCKKILGINAAINPKTGACQPDWAKNEENERDEKYAALSRMRIRKDENKNKIEVYDD